MFKKKTMGKLALIIMSASVLLLQGCGGKDDLTGYDGNAGTSVEQMIQDKLSGMAGAEGDNEEAFTDNAGEIKTAKERLEQGLLDAYVYGPSGEVAV